MKFTVTAILLACLAAPAFAESHEEVPSQEAIDKIMAMLTEMECEMAPDDIELEEEGYDLDDVICRDQGQMDIKLDSEFNEVSRRLE
ncbi:PepSY domain-containing protein [Litorisediminicola beolgyonensis]|uniref:PepSY domain-containing protein n=1 Tax=Litorisediminicola beolgyonensis TaxID=1173614 RepID=A0ABW3ZIQ4_9RHOB